MHLANFPDSRDPGIFPPMSPGYYGSYQSSSPESNADFPNDGIAMRVGFYGKCGDHIYDANLRRWIQEQNLGENGSQ